MPRPIQALCLATAILLATPAGWTTAGASDTQGKAETVTLLVHDGGSSTVLLGDIVPSGFGWHAVEVPLAGSAAATARDLSARLGVEVVTDTVHELHGVVDPLFEEQWALDNRGQTGGVAGADVDAVRAWELSTGADIVVAVLDSGVDVGHPDLAGRIWVNASEIPLNGIDDDGNGYVDDRNGYDFRDGDPGVEDDGGHGTFVAGIVAAGANGTGVVGLAPNATIMPVRVCGGGACLTSDIIGGIQYAVANGANVINMSFGSEDANPALRSAIDAAGDAGLVTVASAGNDGSDNDTDLDGPPVYPASFSSSALIAVTSSDDRDRLPTDAFGVPTANYGATTVDLAAPGENILSLYSGGGYATGSGTSFAGPYVTAAVALMEAAHPGIPAAELADLIRASTDPLAAFASITVSGGRLNAYAAIASAILRDIAGSVFLDDIMWLYGEGITRGCNPPSNDRYCPDATVSRGAMAAFLNRALDLPASGEDYFTDDQDSVFEDDINRLRAAGITMGCNPPANDHYCPEGRVTRGQMAAFLVRAFHLDDAGPGDFFFDDDGSLFEGDIDKLREAGVTLGCNPPANDRYCPDRGVTRGQMAAFLHRAGT